MIFSPPPKSIPNREVKSIFYFKKYQVDLLIYLLTTILWFSISLKMNANLHGIAQKVLHESNHYYFSDSPLTPCTSTHLF